MDKNEAETSSKQHNDMNIQILYLDANKMLENVCRQFDENVQLVFGEEK